jgi:hypothetical protein
MFGAAGWESSGFFEKTLLDRIQERAGMSEWFPGGGTTNARDSQSFLKRSLEKPTTDGNRSSDA